MRYDWEIHKLPEGDDRDRYHIPKSSDRKGYCSILRDSGDSGDLRDLRFRKIGEICEFRSFTGILTSRDFECCRKDK